MENKEPKLIFGLSPLATLLNALVFLATSSLFVVCSLIYQLPTGYDFLDPSTPIPKISIPWYIDFPLWMLSIVMLLRWVEYTFNIAIGDYSLRAILYRYVYLLLFVFLYTSTIKLILLLIFFL